MKTTKTALIALGLLLSGQFVHASEIYQTPTPDHVGIKGAVTNEKEAETLRKAQQNFHGHGPVLLPRYQAPVAGTQAEVGYQAGHDFGNIPTGYQAPVAGTQAEVGYQAQPGHLGHIHTGVNTKGQIYEIPTVTEESLK
ncbi:MAG: hypothetical protein M1114_06495 [Candidatus Dependentiae bacterium]|nr:hypothetical protein [Candidatus Dependentiae bacterium]